MKVLLIYIFVFSYSILVVAQGNYFSISIGSSATSRFLSIKGTNLTSTEFNKIKDLEVAKPSFQTELGYSFERNENLFIRLGFGFRLARFGTKIYRIPDDVHNITPQYGLTKNIIEQNQLFSYIEPNFSQFKILKSSSYFFKLMFVFNQNYTIYQPTYNENKKKGIVGRQGFSESNTKLIDFNLSFGLNYHLFQKTNSKLLVQPYISLFLREKEINRWYLYFDKSTIGNIWDLGLLVQYKFRKQTNDNKR